MDQNEIKKKIQFAKDVVKEENEPFKTEAFKIVLTKLLGSPVKSDSDSQTSSGTSKKDKTESKNKHDSDIPTEDKSLHDTDAKMKKLGESCNLDVEEIKDVLSVRDDKMDLLVTPQGKLGEKQRIASQCILIGHHVILDHEWVNSKILAESLKEAGISDPGGNLAANLKTNTEVFRSRKNGQNLDYKLTTGTGRKTAYETIKNLAKGNQQ